MTPPDERDGFSVTRSLTIEWGHCDPAGIVFNPRFFEFFDWSTALLCEAATGLPKPAMLAAYDLIGIPLVETGARFLRPSRYGDRVEIVSTVVEVGRSSFAVRHRLHNAGELAVEGRERRVWAGRHPDEAGRMKAAPIPEDLARRLRGG
ncbi:MULTISPECIES: acyl-CoA thioesterase [Methylobacterium]|jgi:4-hydroxybenzoyl-CoA thioesterase|uniref:4-hydroxybenzoyl-CoA thioesterase n=1 Tax=Methylobacterium isbiliense TaxID=315478 RepID=A0ABQ4SQD0_9HYPH|nr:MULTISPECIES: thioesterase family protein [Methylobacterium]MBY0296893.1 acyl-CoA thioesterase [Methylobacterium sp.]MDN3626568.1 thioesterase family protein [Methylobacterium isbiliense]GJE03969.1 4-hydroxybenzoyl-CoA thioesterase [Methylobacterium isbiliense]